MGGCCKLSKNKVPETSGQNVWWISEEVWGDGSMIAMFVPNTQTTECSRSNRISSSGWPLAERQKLFLRICKVDADRFRMMYDVGVMAAWLLYMSQMCVDRILGCSDFARASERPPAGKERIGVRAHMNADATPLSAFIFQNKWAGGFGDCWDKPSWKSGNLHLAANAVLLVEGSKFTNICRSLKTSCPKRYRGCCYWKRTESGRTRGLVWSSPLHFPSPDSTKYSRFFRVLLLLTPVRVNSRMIESLSDWSLILYQLSKSSDA